MSEKQECSHDGCETELPTDESKIPPGWTMARVEEYKKASVATYYIYLCPNHTLTSITKQANLFGDEK